MTSKPELLRFTYDGFKTKSSKARKITQVSTDGNGLEWQLNLYPDYPTVALTNNGKDSIAVTLSLVLRDSKGYVAHEQNRGLQHFRGGKSQSFLYLIEWSKIINREEEILRGEDLIIDVQICRVKHAAPPNPFGLNLMKLLDDEDTADVSFKVQGTLIFAHRTLLQANASVLADFCEGSDKSSPAVPIQNTSPTIFRQVLRYVYGGELPSLDIIKAMGIELLGAADRFGAVGLKIALEGMVVRSGVVTVSNVIDFLLFADALNCPQLKEHCTAYFLSRSRDILKTKSASKLKESGKLSFEIMESLLHSDDVYESDSEDYNSWSVEQLRRKLFKKGVLELDGSKRVLLARLREQKVIERGCSTI